MTVLLVLFTAVFGWTGGLGVWGWLAGTAGLGFGLGKLPEYVFDSKKRKALVAKHAALETKILKLDGDRKRVEDLTQAYEDGCRDGARREGERIARVAEGVETYGFAPKMVRIALMKALRLEREGAEGGTQQAVRSWSSAQWTVARIRCGGPT